MSYILYSGDHHENARSQKICVAAAFAGVDVQLKKCTYGVENETAEYQRNCHPCMRFPSLQTPEGHIFESNAILRHIARVATSGLKLYGSTPFEQSLVDSWVDFSTTEIDHNNLPFLIETFMGVPVPENSLPPLEESLSGLELWLENRTYLVGERLTIADIAIAFSLQWVYRINTKHGEALAKKFRNAYRLYNTVMQQPKTVEVLQQWGATFGPIKAPKEAKPAAAKKPAAEKKKKDDEEEDDTPKEVKKKNPLDDLPPSSFDLDSFKREYSNTDTRTVAAPYLFSHFDAAGFTCFWCKYKYNDENKVPFMTANLCRGWFQRMEHTRKYAFGVALIIGEEKQHDIVGLWVFRGKGMPEIVTDVVDTENFDWTEIKDINAEKEKITDYLCWEGPTIGRPVLEGRTFK
ncbi:Glutathione S-transferase, N-terminal domain/Glutathione S-transferase, C-terminal domain/Elongation factor 1 gamma, conserved domain containing protein, putative [Angomonas deanei]|uniref:Glutathione S-transferase, N-terminal domain/Glutathione S-transferase, C-terminal domain/Elongation factor 1 gamma, conserved domain containing protein, putative n=1 Tax=Angomonas deanei TaxID=59799 RepID=A0A7G2CQF4_9TRYP|nr:Glutathione S-transferase, N-terminal domain/Glutathione S-transferase, C-terminal domain/Elongation factor 1 gamma, conserved domain containing protein, putative [Angomonas deanei]